ncbi:MAG: AzlD domain-containing protein [Candidatus Devosia symbiotica]|nr:AzlD domain-containing protein [Candidatus Devosia symbiotica]
MWTSFEALLAIAGMALVSLLTKVGGLLLAHHLPRHSRAAAWLRHIPGGVLAALVAPALITCNPAEIIAAAAAALVYILSRNMFAAMAIGVLVIYLARTALTG